MTSKNNRQAHMNIVRRILSILLAVMMILGQGGIQNLVPVYAEAGPGEYDLEGAADDELEPAEDAYRPEPSGGVEDAAEDEPSLVGFNDQPSGYGTAQDVIPSGGIADGQSGAFLPDGADVPFEQGYAVEEGLDGGAYQGSALYHDGLMDLTGQVVFLEDGKDAAYKPKLALYANGGKTENAVTLKASEDTLFKKGFQALTYSVKDLPVTDQDGKEIRYALADETHTKKMAEYGAYVLFFIDPQNYAATMAQASRMWL